MIKRMILLSIVVFPLASAGSSTAADSTRFRGSDGAGTSAATGLPLEWDDSKNVVWKVAVPGYGASSPITYGERIFVTCYSGYGTGADSDDKANLKLHLVCLRRSDGHLIWDRSIQGNPNERDYQGFIPLHGYASGTPVTDGQRVYAFFGSSGVVACDLDGNLVWQQKVGTRTHNFGTGASPVLYGDLVIVNASVESGALVALDKATGAEVWRKPDVKQAWNTPLLIQADNGRDELVLNMSGQVLAVDPRSGDALWTFNTDIGTYICPSVVSHEGIVYAICGSGGKLFAIRSGGEGDVSESHEVWTTRGRSNVPSPTYFDGHLYWVSDDGMAHCVDAATGEQVYRERLSSGRVYASVLVADGKLYAVSRERGTFVLPAKPEFEELAHNVFESDDSIFNASPVVSNGQLLLKSDRFLYCVGKTDAN